MGEMRIELKKWAIEEKDGVKRISGTYAVMLGKEEIATKDFNGKYDSTTFPFSAQLVADVEALTEKIKNEVIEHYSK